MGKYIKLSIEDYLRKLSERKHIPGGGSASAERSTEPLSLCEAPCAALPKRCIQPCSSQFRPAAAASFAKGFKYLIKNSACRF